MNKKIEKHCSKYIRLRMDQHLGPVVQSPISTNPGLTLNKTYRVNNRAQNSFEKR